MNKWVKGILISLVPVVLIGAITIADEIAAAKRLVVSFHKVKITGATARQNDWKNSLLNLMLSLWFHNPTATRLKAKRLRLNFVFQGKSIATLQNNDSLSFAPKQMTEKTFSVRVPAQPFAEFVTKYFQSSKIPVRVVGSVDVFTSAIGSYVTIPIDLEFNIKEEIETAVLSYLKVQ